MKASVLFAQFPGQYITQPSAADWVADAMAFAKGDPRFGEIKKTRLVGTPITALRNKACNVAIQGGFDYLVMVDSDMFPDMNGKDWPSDKKFFQSSFDFIFSKHLHLPCLIAAPYVGPPPYENCYVFLWRNRESGHNNPDWSLEGYQREEAAKMAGIQRCAAIPTGVCIIDVRGLKYLAKPWFYYGYKDESEADVVMTEDVAFSRNWSMAPAPDIGLPDGLPVYCNWDAWACHWKMKMCGKPQSLTEDDVSRSYKKAAASGVKRNEKMVVLGETPFDPAPVRDGSSIIFSISDQPNDPRAAASWVPACSRGEFDAADVIHTGMVMAPPNNLVQKVEVMAEPAPDVAEWSFRVPTYETEEDLVSGIRKDYGDIRLPTDFPKLEYPSDPLAATPPFAPAHAACDVDACNDLPAGFCLRPRDAE